MKHANRPWARALAGLLLAIGMAGLALAADDAPTRKDLVLKGDAVCTRCHDESESLPVRAIG